MKGKYQKWNGKSNEEAFKFKTDLFGKTVDIVLDLKEGIQHLVGDVGLMLANAVIEEEVQQIAGRKNEHMAKRKATRWAKQQGYVRIGGQKVNIKRPRIRTVDGKKEVELPIYKALQKPHHDREMIYNRMVRGISTRDYKGTVDGFLDGYGLSRGTVNREFIRVSINKVRELTERSLSGKAFVVICIDGIEVGGQTVVAAIGIKMDGNKEMLGIWEGATENTEVCKGLIENLVERGLCTQSSYMFVIDGSKALRKAIRSEFGEKSCIQRCQLHKRRNVRRHLKKGEQENVDRMMQDAYWKPTYKEAKEELMKIARYLEQVNPSAAASLREGMEETLTVHNLELRGNLRRILSNTNFVESPFSMTRTLVRRVKRWRNGAQVFRWVAVGLLEAEKRFRRVHGFRDLKTLSEKLQQQPLTIKN